MFYMNMLREQDELMGNTGFDPDMVVNSDDKYAIDLKDIAQAVEDINDEYAEESEQEELDGQDLHEDPVAECVIAIYESEHNWNTIMQAIGTQELMEAARGRDMVMEAADVAGFIDSVKEFFVRQFAKISKIVKEFMEKHSIMARVNAAFAKKYSVEKLKEGKVAFEKKEKHTFTGYNFKVQGAKYVLEGEAFNAKECSISSIEEITDKALPEVDVVRGRYVGDSKCEKGNYRDALKARYFGEKGTLSGDSIDPVKVHGVIANAMKDIKDCKEAYNAMKKSYNQVIADLNKIKKGVDKAHKDSEMMSKLTKHIAAVKECKNVGHMAFTTMLAAMRANQAQAIRVAHAYVAAAGAEKKAEKKAAKKTEKANESAGFFGALELL